jgi:hypothetical protein
MNLFNFPLSSPRRDVIGVESGGVIIRFRGEYAHTVVEVAFLLELGL